MCVCILPFSAVYIRRTSLVGKAPESPTLNPEVGGSIPAKGFEFAGGRFHPEGWPAASQ